MNTKSTSLGHLAAFFTIVIWGTTFIATKVLLQVLTPVEILFYRFFLGYLILWLVVPKNLKLDNHKQELYFMAAGLLGVTLYFLLENFALTFTLAANVGVIIAIAPFFTALFDYFFLHGERPRLRFFIGFFVAITGICLISFRGDNTVHLNPAGDLLAIAAAVVWAGYSTFTKRISTFGYGTILTTRRIFFYGLVFMIPALFIFGFHLDFSVFTEFKNLANILFLGFGASALCFVTWNLAVKLLGPVKTSVYIYMVPVITVVTSVIILHEHVTLPAALGIGLTIAGLFLSESRLDFKRQKTINEKEELRG